ncbi:hypothetical protein [Pseudomonas sp. NPDC086251]|uniref:hypothetical protein n=1 Tax=Pseudomonas sp. NPDC086251 TaxID=3364431 RepID=UPI0038374165
MNNRNIAFVSLLILFGCNAYASDGAERLQQRMMDNNQAVIVSQQKVEDENKALAGTQCQDDCNSTTTLSRKG